MMNSIENKYAVVGMGGIFPDASDVNHYWHNILNKKVSIGPISDTLIDKEVFYRPEMYGKIDKNDKTYTELTSCVKEINFDPRQFRITPMAAKHMDDNQKVSLLCAQQALKDGSLENVSKDRISVIMGNSLAGDLHIDFITRFNFDRFSNHLKKNTALRNGLPEDTLHSTIEELRSNLLNHTFPVTEDSAPGVLPNLVAARICSVFDFHGNAFTVDAACASGLAAIICGIQQLKNRDSDAVICGAVDMLSRVPGMIYFSGINALSPNGSFPFDKRADGFVIGQGGGLIILKRLSDALQSNDKIHAVITGYGQSSDGKGKAIAAPNEVWQAKTIQKAYEMAGYPIDTVEYIEAHGTATQVGDASEVSALKKSFQELGVTKKGFCGLSSVKSNIGHLKSAAGIAGFIKAVLAINNKTLPPTANFQTLNPKLQLEDSPFYVVSEAREWIDREHPRRAGISAFGFGGADYHIAIEEFRSADYRNFPKEHFETSHTSPDKIFSKVSPGTELMQKDRNFAFFSADSADILIKNVEDFIDMLGKSNRFSEELFKNNYTADPRKKIRLAFTFESMDDLKEKALSISQVHSSSGKASQLSLKGIYWNDEPLISAKEMAFLFPGQGSQYPDMILDIRKHYSIAATTLSRSDMYWEKVNNCTVSGLIDSSEAGKDATDKLLKNTRNTHPAIFTSSMALYSILKEMNVEPAVMIGHSLGEIAALAASGKISFKDALALIDSRSRSFGEIPAELTGAMAALKMNAQEAAELIKTAGTDLWIANVNSPVQTIVSGSLKDIESLQSICTSKNIQIVRLNVSHAFHSPLMKPAEDLFRKSLEKVTFTDSPVKVIANQFNTYYGDTDRQIREQLGGQITGSVNFSDSINLLYNEGIRVFVEVGPGNVLSSLTAKILDGKDFKTFTSNNKNTDAAESFNRMLCGLFSVGIDIDLIPQNSRYAQEFSNHIQVKTSQSSQPQSSDADRIVYSGVSVGLPGSFKKAFRDDNFNQLFEGRNQIERLTDAEREKLVELKISKLIKSAQGANYVTLDSLNQVIQLAGKIGQIDPINDYHIDEKDLKIMGSAVVHAVAAGYEALRDAQIPLIHEYSKTSSGGVLPDRWALPQEMQKDTGIIFANSFPMIDVVISEVSRHISYKLSTKLKHEIFEFYDTLISNISHPESRKILSDWFALNYSRLSLNPSQKDVYTFNHHFMTQISLQANNYLAKFINARGPNFTMNAACSTTATAIAVAEEFIRSGRVKRMIIIGGDDASSESTLPYIGAGFLSTGACSNEADLYEAAVPFDKRRNGMIMGSGAVGIVVEAEQECNKRGVIPICELMGTHCFNAAAHHSQLDVPRYAEEMDFFIDKMEKRHGFSRSEVAGRLLYLSHETYTPARGGCAEAEAVSLRHVFGDDFNKIEISNTKGMTGHTMGASIEDATAAKALQYSKVPPVVNFKYQDPALDGLKLSKGGEHNSIYALRMAAGFGSQGNFLLLKKIADKDSRIADRDVYNTWLKSVSGIDNPELQVLGRTLIIKDSKPGAVIVNRPKIDIRPNAVSEKLPASKESQHVEAQKKPTQTVHQISSSSENEIRSTVFSVISEVTGYSVDMLDSSMELEADLGVDTVKQATILAMLSEELGLDKNDGFRISDFPTISKIVEFFISKTADHLTINKEAISSVKSNSVLSEKPAGQSLNHSKVKESVLEVIAEITGYGIEMLDENMEMEADLGVDTVKQATILSRLAEKFNLSRDINFRISDYPTIKHTIEFFKNCQIQAGEEISENVTLTDDSDRIAEPQIIFHQNSSKAAAGILLKTSVESKIIDIISNNSPYPPEMIEPDLQITSDLGLTSDNIRKIVDSLISEFDLEKNWSLPDDIMICEIISELNSRKSDNVAFPEELLTQVNLARQVPVLQQSALHSKKIPISDKSVLIIGDNEDTITVLKSILNHNVKHIDTFVFPETPLLENSSGKEIIADKPDIIIDCTAIGTMPGHFTDLQLQDACNSINRASDSRFAFCKYLQERKLLPERILALISADGSFGLKAASDRSINPVYGLYDGFYKALQKEWGNVFVSIVDVAEGTVSIDSPENIRQIIQNELETISSGIEICYLDNTRYKVVVEDRLFPSANGFTPLLANDVLVVTGGATGITSKVVLQLGKYSPAAFMLLGRTEPVKDVERYEQMTAEELQNQKSVIRENLKSTTDRVTPVMVEQEFARIIKSIEIRNTIKQLQNSGCRAEYYSVDICNFEKLKKALDKIRAAYGPVTGIIHGAGIEISHMIDKKSLDEFHRVQSIKTYGAYNLSVLCKNDPLRTVVAFSSISGMFGNAAQTDYSAANSFLNFWVRMFKQRSVNAVSLVWSGWGDTGMACRNTFVKDNSEAIGLNLLSSHDAANAAVREICGTCSSTDIVIHDGLGSILTSEVSQIDMASCPLIDRVELDNSGIKAVHRRISVSRDEFINQHRLADTPLMPGVGFMEMMAETYSILKNNWTGQIVFNDLQFTDAFKLYHNKSRKVTVDISKCDSNGTYHMKVMAPINSSMNSNLRQYCKAILSSEAEPLIFNAADWGLGETSQISLRHLFANNNKFPQNVNFGPLFCDLKRSDSKSDYTIDWNNNGLSVKVEFPRAQLNNPKYPLQKYLINPAFLDTIHQAGALCSTLITNQIYLPFGADKFIIFKAPDIDQDYIVRAKIKERFRDKIIYDIILTDNNNEVFCFVVNSISHFINQ